MKKILLSMLAMLAVCLNGNAASYRDYTWAQICSGKMGTTWYPTKEAMSIADTLIGVQKVNGGWMKNDQYHLLTSSQLAARKALTGTDGRNAHSCFDNYSTTQEMRFLANMYKYTKKARYKEAFQKAVNLIIEAGQNKNGGWGQYWPDTNDIYSYQNYITFNDDLMTNMMKMLQDIYEAQGAFKGIVDEATKQRCKEAYDAALQCVINCQIDDNGVYAAWCAQHDPADFLPAEGRPHELPSVSAYESATLLSYLMTIKEPSEELQWCIRDAVEWLKNHKYRENCYIEDVKDADGNTIDRKISSKGGSNIWGRFIQIGGEKGKEVYEKFYNKLKARGKQRKHHLTGFNYYEYQILADSYDASKEYQPIFAVYSDSYPELFYRHLYSYEDTPDKIDSYGQRVITSLPAANRKSYQYLGSWPDKIINNEFPAWDAAHPTPVVRPAARSKAGVSQKVAKVFNGGKLFIVKDNSVFTATGAQIK